MEYKKSGPTHGKLNSRYATLYEYEFPRATRKKGPFLPKGSLRLREFLFSDGEHGQLIQIIRLTDNELDSNNEKRLLVDKLLDIQREEKKFTEGNLNSEGLTGEIREYSKKKMLSLGHILPEKEKIGLFASARLIRDSRRRMKRVMCWKIRIQIFIATSLIIMGVFCGSFLQRHRLLDLENNKFYQNYVVTTVKVADAFFDRLSR
ncbi:MAG: hypothetical protein OQL18_11705 [Deltaproteobacteria bacterium]|jgi:hypothetical protein|nr:hypothetical protein [Deltaproteobacteria bacterium]